MFDPTVYDNLKVVVEGKLYDYDLKNKITILDRKDIVDLATLSRSFSLTFKLNTGVASAMLTIYTNVEDLATEILEQVDEEIGCYLHIGFNVAINDIDQDGDTIKFLLAKTWRKYQPYIEQHISFPYGTGRKRFENDIDITFEEKWNEDDIDRLPQLILDMLDTLRSLDTYFSKEK